MSALSRFAQRFQRIENIAPRPWRLPLRYHGQRLVGGLEPEMGLLKQLVPKGCVALDIGANHGIYAYALSRLAGSVHCFEPLGECCCYICDYRAPNITVHNVALSDRTGSLEFHIPVIRGHAVYTRASLNPQNGPSESRRVEVQTLDSLALAQVGFMKIDVEGAEAAVLRGGQITIEATHPAILLEVDRSRHTEESFKQVFLWMNTRGYCPHVCNDGKLTKCVDPWQESAHHVNFIFI